jgi:Ala-tRNA(Pro) deacylase
MDIHEFLKQNHVEFVLHDHAPAYTAQMVAAEEHVTGHEVAKVVIVKGEGKLYMCVVPAPRMVDMRKVGRITGAKDVRLADEAETSSIFPDVEVGAEPPFGNLYDLPTLVDRRLAQRDQIVFQGGSHREAVRVRYTDYAQLARPREADPIVDM